MFLRIGNERIKIASIGSYEDKGKSPHTTKFYLDVKISGRIKSFAFDSQQRLDEIVVYLDKVLKVQVV